MDIYESVYVDWAKEKASDMYSVYRTTDDDSTGNSEITLIC